ncbi:unnamed protein product [Spirodela intermedia]|uniref:Uncharacterized protein n=1 Tax=Spirodela intermedia TaxID=51605 RepID=A0A7I8JY76_SPIIN|nr:unnamed protein product [Spirodela intermedia]
MELRRGPWTVEEDLLLINYIAIHGEGRWNSLAHCAGLKRTGKSCRLRWLNYLRPDVRRGNITPEEQLLILELHSRWGNRWSKIAQHLPGRTDNEIKNYWRTRVQKHAKQLKCDVNSKQFKDAMRYLWMPRLMERISAASSGSRAVAGAGAVQAFTANHCAAPATPGEPWQSILAELAHAKPSSDNSSAAGPSESESSAGTYLSSPPVSDLTDCYGVHYGGARGFVDDFPAGEMMAGGATGCPETLPPLSDGYFGQGLPGFEPSCNWGQAGDFSPENLWGADDIWLL